MESEGDYELFGLPDEIGAAVTADVDDWDEWQIEGMVAHASYAVEERRSQIGQVRVDQETMSMLLAFMAQESEWGIDEPLALGDLVVAEDEDGF